jgi:putative tricarboxylic transport membrane protein
VAPPGLTDGERDKLIGLVTKLHESEQWQESMKKNGWDDAFLTGDKFGDFLDQQDDSVDQVLKELGL